MKKVKITALRKTEYPDLIELLENPLENACTISIGDTFISEEAEIPDNFCSSAWDTLKPFVMTLAYGGEDFFNGWMKNPKSALLSCNDGFRPVSFLIETLEED